MLWLEFNLINSKVAGVLVYMDGGALKLMQLASTLK